MKVNSETQILGLFGNPSRHSFSPLIQNHFLKSYGINSVYFSFEPNPADLSAAFNGAKSLNFTGLNVTMPFKDQIYDFLDMAEGAARITKSVNTIKFLHNENISIGYSTDGEGLIKSLEDKKFTWNGKRCFIIGAGGAAKSAVYSLFGKPLDKIYIYDIKYDKSVELINTITANILKFQDEKSLKNKPEKRNEEIKNSSINKIFQKKPAGKKISKIYTKDADKILDEIDKKIKIFTFIEEIENNLSTIDLIINCSPAGMDMGTGSGNINGCPVPKSWNLKDKFIFDMVYKPVETVFLKKALLDGAAAIIPGTDMLINQAAYSFKVWFDIMPEKNIIIEVKNILKDEISCKKR